MLKFTVGVLRKDCLVVFKWALFFKMAMVILQVRI